MRLSHRLYKPRNSRDLLIKKWFIVVMTEKVDESWWEILLITLKAEGRPLTISELLKLFSAGRFSITGSELQRALNTLKERGIVQVHGLHPTYWSLTDDADKKDSTGRGTKDTVARSLLDLIEKAYQAGDKRSVAILEHALSRLYSNDDSV
jgi:hypothetical protein